MDQFSHLVDVDEKTRTLTIFRVDPATGRQTLFTSIEIPSDGLPDRDTAFREFARMLGENLLLDSPAARRLLRI